MSSSVALLIYLAIAAVLGLIALAFIAWALTIWSRSRAAQAWPSAAGTILTSEVVEASDGGDASANSFYAHVTYTYDVEGRRYQGDRLSLGRASGSRRPRAEQLAAAYPPGRSVAVYYDPADPGNAALSREPAGSRGLIGAALALLLLTIGLYPLIVVLVPSL